MENQVETKEKSLVFWLAVLVVLTIGIVGLFAMLKVALPNSWEAQIWDEMTVEKTAEGSYQMRMLDERERTDGDVRMWMDKVFLNRALVSDLGTLKDKAYWLYLQEEDYYVLYLPEQDRVLTLQDMTVTEEADLSGEVTLVIRARTAEDSEQVVPEEQLFAIKTNSSAWRGIRVSVILDGREKSVEKLVAKDGSLYSAEEVYIGRF